LVGERGKQFLRRSWMEMLNLREEVREKYMLPSIFPLDIQQDLGKEGIKGLKQ
jgi:hypothetical protein